MAAHDIDTDSDIEDIIRWAEEETQRNCQLPRGHFTAVMYWQTCVNMGRKDLIQKRAANELKKYYDAGIFEREKRRAPPDCKKVYVYWKAAGQKSEKVT